MRVIVTTPNWTLNGVNTFSLSLVRGLQQRGVDVTLLVTGSMWRDDKPLPTPGDVSLEYLVLPRLATWPARWRALSQRLETAAPCIYLPNHDIFHSGIAPTLSSNVGIIGIAHSDDELHYTHAQRLGRWWNATVGVSERITAELESFEVLAGARIAHIPYGVAIGPDVKGQDRAAGDGTVDAKLRIVYAGRLEQRQKRVGDLVDVAAALRARQVPFVLTIAGDGPQRAELQRRTAALGLSAVVRFAGTVAPDAMAALYAEHEVFLLPSAYEGLPLALLEAMAQGCIPVVSDLPSGVSELVQHGVNGFRVPVGDVAAFAACLADLASTPERRLDVRVRARHTVARGPYNVETMTTAYESLCSAVHDDLVTGKYSRPRGAVVSPPDLDWRARLRAPLVGWRGQRPAR